MRRQGKTYGEIRLAVNRQIPKSTLSNWCKNVILPNEYNERLKKIIAKNSEKSRAYALVINKIRREKYLQSIIEKEKRLAIKLRDKDVAKIALSMLYLGEGAKWKGHSGLFLGSSDPDIILLYILLLAKCHGIKSNQLRCRIGYRADQNIRKLERYWSHVTKIPIRNFYKTKPDPRTKGKKTRKVDYKGVCVITCAGARIQLELEALAKLFLENLRAHSLEEKR